MTIKVQLKREVNGVMQQVNPITSEECVILSDGKKLNEVMDFATTAEDFVDEAIVIEENLVDRIESIENRIVSEFEEQNSQITTGLSNIKTIEQNISNKVDTEVAKVNAQLSAKAPLTTVVEQGKRIDTIIANANNTDGNSELVDMRVSSNGTVFQTAGEHLRNVSSSVLSYKKFHLARVQSGGDSESNVVLVNPSNDFVTMTATNTGGASYQYVYVQLSESIQNMVDNPKLIKILLNPSFTGTFNVAVSGKTNWSSGVVNRQDLFMEKGVSQIIEIDFSDSAIQEWLKDSSKSQAVYIFFIFIGNGPTDFASGTRTISVGMFDINTGTNKKVLSEISFNSVLAECATSLSTDLQEELSQNIKNETTKEIISSISDIPLGVKTFSADTISTQFLIKEQVTPTKYRLYRVDTETPATSWLRAYIQIKYDDLENLDTNLRFNLNYANSDTHVKFNNCKILSRKGDWGPSANAIDIFHKINDNINLYDTIMEKAGVRDVYLNQNELWIVFGYFTGNSADYTPFTMDCTIEPMFEAPNSMIIASDLNSSALEKVTTSVTDVVMEKVGNELQLDGGYITCWGDSLTAGGGWTSTLESLTGMKVYNGGTGGENSQTIMARQGGDVMIVDNLVIPATTDPVTIATRSDDAGIKTALGNKVTPLLQGGAHFNPCYIGDIEGTLRWTGSSHADQTGVWTFTRSEAGERVVVNRPTAIRTDFDINRNRPRIMIIFIGQNGGYSSVDDLINQHRLMIEHSQATNFIVLGLSSGTASQRADYEKAMRKEFGRRFISLREYLSQYGLEDAGIEPTEQDLQMMEQGQTPQSLLSDSVHYNAQCKTVIGNMIYKKLKELNMI